MYSVEYFLQLKKKRRPTNDLKMFFLLLYTDISVKSEAAWDFFLNETTHNDEFCTCNMWKSLLLLLCLHKATFSHAVIHNHHYHCGVFFFFFFLADYNYISAAIFGVTKLNNYEYAAGERPPSQIHSIYSQQFVALFLRAARRLITICACV